MFPITAHSLAVTYWPTLEASWDQDVKPNSIVFILRTFVLSQPRSIRGQRMTVVFIGPALATDNRLLLASKRKRKRSPTH